MKRAPRSRQRHDLYAKYHDYDSEISDLLGECGINGGHYPPLSPRGRAVRPDAYWETWKTDGSPVLTKGNIIL